MHKENISPKPLAGKTRGVDFHELLQQIGLKDWSLKSHQEWLVYTPEGIALLLEKRQVNDPGTDGVETAI